MKTIRLLLACATLSTLNLQLSTALAQGTAFTYQGVLSQGGAAINGSNDLTFTLYNAVSAGATVGTSNVVNDLVMTNGLFTVTLDFGAGAFDGTARWLQIAARPGASTGAYTNLAPRTPITATPYAMFAGGAALSGTYGSALNFNNAANQFSGTGSNLTALNASQLTSGSIADARLSANVALRAGGNAFTGQQTITGGNLGIRTTNPMSSIGYPGGWDGLHIQAPGGSGINVIQGTFSSRLHLRTDNNLTNIAQDFVIASGANEVDFQWLGAGLANRLLAMTITTNGNIGVGTATPVTTLDVRSATPEITVGTLGGTAGALYLGNAAHGVKRAYRAINDVGLYTTAADVYLSANGATTNQFVLKNNGQVGIGTANPGALLHLVSGNDPTLKLQSDGFDEISGRVSMRQNNESGFDTYYDGHAAVDGLVFESFTSGTPTTKAMVIKLNGNVGIGTTNPISAIGYPGGWDGLHVRSLDGNGLAIIQGTNSARLHLRADGNATNGAQDFVIANGANKVDFTWLTAGLGNRLQAMSIATNGNVTINGEVTTTAVNITSDRNAKEQFKPVNGREVLAKVARLPISEWQYKTQSDARHIGPMAQDFREAFSLGRDEKHITSVDADGVALAAIQGLNEKLEEKTQEVDALKKSVAALTELVNKLAAQQNGGAR